MIGLPPPANDVQIDDNLFLALAGHFDEPPAEREDEFAGLDLEAFCDAHGCNLGYELALYAQVQKRQHRARLIAFTRDPA